jgi:hypothetical protein
VSDTPRTNLEAFLPHDSKYQVCDADFCRQLERELNAANEMFRKLNIHALNLTDRIRRLEEAGNNLLWSFCPEYTSDLTQEQSDALKQWNKAKEAKP